MKVLGLDDALKMIGTDIIINFNCTFEIQLCNVNIILKKLVSHSHV